MFNLADLHTLTYTIFSVLEAPGGLTFSKMGACIQVEILIVTGDLRK